MISVERNELRNIRMRIAVGICEQYPEATKSFFTNEKVIYGDEVKVAIDVLKALMKLEPSLKIVLEFINLKK